MLLFWSGKPNCIIDTASFWANLYLSKPEPDFISKLIIEGNARAKAFHGTFRFIDDFCALYGGGELQKSYKGIYHLTIKRLRGQFDPPS